MSIFILCFMFPSLKKCYEVPTVINHPPILHLSSPYCPIPESILERRMVKKGNKVVCQVLVKWSGSNASQATWEFLYELQHRFLHFTIEDKGGFHWGY